MALPSTNQPEERTFIKYARIFDSSAVRRTSTVYCMASRSVAKAGTSIVGNAATDACASRSAATLPSVGIFFSSHSA